MTNNEVIVMNKDTPYVYETRINVQDGLQPILGYKSKNQSTVTNYFHGQKLAGYRRLIAKKGDATTPAEGQMYKINVGGGYVFATFDKVYQRPDLGEYTTSSEGNFVPVQFPPLPDVGTRAFNTALGNFYTSVSQAHSEFKGGVFLGELKEAIHSVKHPLEGMKRVSDAYLDSAKKLTKFKRRAERVDSLRNLYLEYTFAIVPLISDVKSLCKAIVKITDQAPSIRVRGFGKETVSSNVERRIESFGISKLSGPLTIKSETVVEVSLVGSVALETGSYGAIGQLGFRPEEFIPTLWELLPGSFLVDYVSNVGNLLNSICNAYAQTSYSCAVVRRISRASCHHEWAPSYAYPSKTGGGSQSWDAEHVRFTRDKFSPSIPTLQLELPNVGQAVNFAALIAKGAYVSRLLQSF